MGRLGMQWGARNGAKEPVGECKFPGGNLEVGHGADLCSKLGQGNVYGPLAVCDSLQKNWYGVLKCIHWARPQESMWEVLVWYGVVVAAHIYL